jgi:hypothetical protein
VLTSKLSTIARGALGLLLMLTRVFGEVVGIVAEVTIYTMVR